MKQSIVIYLLLSAYLYALPSVIAQQIARSGIAKKDVSIYIKEVGNSGRVLVSHNAYKTRTPASVIKVLTTYASLLKFGFQYRWPTQFYYNGSLRHGTLKGDLVIKGFGNPTLSSEDLEGIVSRIKTQGIRNITGNIIIDRSYFKVGNRDSSRFDNHPYSPYNAMPDAMMFNERTSTISITPKTRVVRKETPDYSYKVINQLKFVNKPCRGKYAWVDSKVDESQAVPRVFLKGKLSKRCAERKVCKVITKPYKAFYYALKEKLKEEGVKVKGTLRLRRVPQNAKALFTYYSEPLEKIVSKTAKESNNLFARHLLLHLGAKVYGAPATVDKGRKAIMDILKEKGALSQGRLRIDNGSGLSRTSKISAKILADMYEHAYSRYGNRWMKTLSIAGEDGTIKKRFANTIVENRAWMKTGTLKYVKNIGGYVKNRWGRLYTVVILINSPKARYRATKLQNEIIKWAIE